MKATVKSFTTALALITTMSFSSIVLAEEIALPVVIKPAALQEGIQRDLTPAQIAELLPWAKDSKVFLIDLLQNIQTLTTSEKVSYMEDGIKSIVGQSAPKNSELLMRYVLNRGLVIDDILSKEVNADSVGAIDSKLRVLRSSIDMAIKYYDMDLAVMNKTATTSFASFGSDYFSFLNELNKSVFDASAQYAIQRTALEFLQWDLYRDLNNTKYAASIVKINNGLKVFQNKKVTDAQAIGLIRQMKSLSSQLGLSGTGVGHSVPDNKEFNTLMAKKKMLNDVPAIMEVISESMRYVTTTEQYLVAIDPGVENPTPAYVKGLGKVAYDTIEIFLKTNPSLKDMRVFVNSMYTISDIFNSTERFIPRLKSASEYIDLLAYAATNPSDNYVTRRHTFIVEHMSDFMNLNPTQQEIDTLTK